MRGLKFAVPALAAMLVLPACQEEEEARSLEPPALVGADTERGKLALRLHGCTTCHVAPGVVGGNQRIGPTLVGFTSRRYVAGSLPNTPENAIHWIVSPQAITPDSAMPDMGVDYETARDIVAYLRSQTETEWGSGS
ncbi:c-type cytochrome [Microvirga roseola]|uniref:c-type cytochrome n=1 Tax=Microvirga roseola TaxID=2883126 RepID=UPI001E585EBD|nr:c-type cytochrome [Microvirga roseola]